MMINEMMKFVYDFALRFLFNTSRYLVVASSCVSSSKLQRSHG